MTEWYYVKNNQQFGPISFTELQDLAQRFEIYEQDLVWNADMKDWAEASTIIGLYSQPLDVPNLELNRTNITPDIQTFIERANMVEPGTQKVSIMKCIKRGFQLTFRNFFKIIAIGILYFLVISAANIGVRVMDTKMGFKPINESITHYIEKKFPDNEIAQSFVESFNESFKIATKQDTSGASNISPNAEKLNSSQELLIRAPSAWAMLISVSVTIWLLMGMMKFLLNVSSGQKASPFLLFSCLPKIISGVVGGILFYIFLSITSLLLVIPGVIYFLTYQYWILAMVDRRLGCVESFTYSRQYIKGNRWRILGLIIILCIINAIGVISIIGWIFTVPATALAWVLAFRWLQFGKHSCMDDPETKEPLIKHLCKNF